MKAIKLRTKIEAAMAIIFVIILAVAGVASVTRIISDSSDNSYTFIRNSNGNYWEPIDSNVQLAINDLTSGGTVWLPSGTLTITSRIYLNSNVALVGGGVGSTTIFSDQSGAFIPITVDGKQNVTISGLTIDMNSKGSNGIYIKGGAKNIWVTDISLYNVGFQGIYFSSAQYVFVSNVKVKHGSNSASHGFGVLNLKDSVIDNCIFENYDYDISENGIDFNGCDNLTVSNIIIKGNGWHDGIKTPESHNILMNNIIIKDTTNNGMKLQMGSNNYVNNFYIENCGQNGISCQSTLHNSRFSNGYIKNTRSGIGLTTAASDISFSDIEISSSSGRNLGIGGGNNIQLSNVRVLNGGSYNKISSGTNNLLITNCIFSYNNGHGLSIDGASNFKITNCIFEENTQNGIDTTISACKYYTIMDCMFMYNAEGIDCNVNDDWNTITLNHFIGDTLSAYSQTKGLIENNMGIDI